MILTSAEITRHVEQGTIVIRPYTDNHLNPNSYDLRLGHELLVYDNDTLLDCRKRPCTHLFEIPNDGFLLTPGQLYLGQTMEWTETPQHIPMIEGRSSIGRLGIFVHVTAGFGDLGFRGHWTLEITVVKPVIIYPGIRICQIYYHCPSGLIAKSYEGKYQDASNVEASKLWQDFK